MWCCHRLLPFLHVWRRPVARSCSGLVSRMRYLSRLKQDEEACGAALQAGSIFLFHRLAPLLCTANAALRAVPRRTTDVQALLHTLGANPGLVKDAVLIGCSEDNQAQFCLDVGELQQRTVEAAFEGTFMDLRRAFFLLTAPDAPLVAKAQALLRWHQNHRFSSSTGQPAHRNQAGSQRVCSVSGAVQYPMMAPVVLILVSDGRRCLLGRQPSFPPGMYSALAGFCDMGESLEEALCREVVEEVGLEVEKISYSSSQHWPFPSSSFMLGCHAHVSPAHTTLSVDHDELEDARWFSREQISAALQVAPPRRGQAAPPLWVPPSHALAHRLIVEWLHAQHSGLADL